jgi:hypothetical protein
VVAEPLPDPGEIGDAEMGEHERRLRISLAELERVAAERGDAEAGVDRHGQPVLGCDGENLRNAGMLKVEPLRPRMQLHPAGARGQAALQLPDRIGVRIEPTERDKATFRRCGGSEHRIVRLAVAGALHQREDDSPSLDQRQRIGELAWRARPSFGIVAAHVSMSIKQPHLRQLHDKAAKARQQKLIRVHARPR